MTIPQASASSRSTCLTLNDETGFELRREREFYSYYEAVCSLSEEPTSLCNLNDQASVQAHQPVSSPDKALTAFAQLTALRLKARRAMIFFFDTDYAYVLAESTRSLSLQDVSLHDSGDALWLGATKLPRGFSVCEVTTDLPSNEGSNACDPYSSTITHVVNDLLEDKRFCNRPYVLGGPKARFYAGSPITTPNGINIGALCVLDDDPREGLADHEIRFLTEMSTTVMTHLEMLRAKVENQRNRDMTVALGTFKAGKSHFEPTTKSQSTPSIIEDPASVNSGLPNSHSSRPKYNSASSSESETQQFSSDTTANDASDTTANGTVVKDFGLKEPEASPHATAAQLQEQMLSNDVKDTLNRAARLIRETLDVDGALFLDASVGIFGGVVDSSQGLTETSTDISGSGSDTNMTSDFDRVKANLDGLAKFCPVLAKSLNESSSRQTGSANVDVAPNYSNITEEFLRTLLRRYPMGQIWTFDENGDEVTVESPDESLTWASANESADPDTETAGSSKRIQKRKSARASDGRNIQKLFPTVRSLILVGMWDSHKECWFAGSIAWTYSPTRLMSTESELSFMTAFGDVILAEIGRIESKLVDRTKSDFISSISHELRSPLHGILGSAECLRNENYDTVGREMIQSIHTCGTALLDIINNLLEHSRINNISRKTRMTRAIDLRPKTKSAKKSASKALGGLLVTDHGVPLDVVTEEAVETACAGFIHRGPLQNNEDSAFFGGEHQEGPINPNVIVTFNIEQSSNPNWIFSVAAGAWKRVCLNLVANALKFTKTGHITVTLHKAQSQAERQDNKGAHVVLTVTDTGSGMSRAFQTQGLFRPFQQEDGLSEGTGLGLNLVANIVKSQAGTVQVKSNKGVGTSVIVTLPLEYSKVSGDLRNVKAQTEKLFSNVLVGFAGFRSLLEKKSPATDAKEKLLASVRKSCAQLGMNTYVVGNEVDDSANFHFILEHAIRNDILAETDTQSCLQQTVEHPFVIMCDTQISALNLQSLLSGTTIGERAAYVWQPIGPARLVEVTSACLGRLRSTVHRASSTSTLDSASLENSSGSTDRSTSPSDGESHETDVTLIEKTEIVSEWSHGHIVDSAPRVSGSASKSKVTTIKSRKRSPPRRVADRLAKDHSGRRSPSPLIGRKKPLSLLLVDDNGVNLKLLMLYAKKAKHSYTTAEDGQEALETYKLACSPTSKDTADETVGSSGMPSKPSVIIMDINMPVMNGYEASRRIREFEKKEGVEPATIIALTALGNTEAQIKAHAHGMDLFLTKPVKLKELTALLANLGNGSSSAESGAGSGSG